MRTFLALALLALSACGGGASTAPTGTTGGETATSSTEPTSSDTASTDDPSGSPTCADTVCQPDERCELREVQCIRAPCPPLPTCVRASE